MNVLQIKKTSKIDFSQMCLGISTLVYIYSFLRITDNYLRTNWYLV